MSVRAVSLAVVDQTGNAFSTDLRRLFFSDPEGGFHSLRVIVHTSRRPVWSSPST